MKHTKKIIALILIIFAAWFIWQRFNSKDKNADTDSYTISRDNVIETVSASGEVVPVEYVNLSFAIPALVEWVGVDVGDKVKKDQDLMKLDRDSIIAEIQSAKINVEKAVATEQQARRHWDKYKPEEKYRIKKDVEQANAQLYGAQSQLSKTKLVSPIDGIVTQKNVQIGEIAGGTVMRIIDDSEMKIEVLMSESDAAKMHEGQRAFVVFDAYNDDEFDVKIESIDPEAIDVQDVTYYKITFDLSEKVEKKILSGMSVDVDVIVNKNDNVLVVPLRYVRRDEKGDYVYVAGALGSSDYDKKYITTGIESDDGNVEIIDGISEGEVVYAIYEE